MSGSSPGSLRAAFGGRRGGEKRLRFENLEALEGDACAGLSGLSLEGPRLLALALPRCGGLEYLDVLAPRCTFLDLSGCARLSAVALDRGALSARPGRSLLVLASRRPSRRRRQQSDATRIVPSSRQLGRGVATRLRGISASHAAGVAATRLRGISTSHAAASPRLVSAERPRGTPPASPRLASAEYPRGTPRRRRDRAFDSAPAGALGVASLAHCQLLAEPFLHKFVDHCRHLTHLDVYGAALAGQSGHRDTKKSKAGTLHGDPTRVKHKSKAGLEKLKAGRPHLQIVKTRKEHEAPANAMRTTLDLRLG